MPYPKTARLKIQALEAELAQMRSNPPAQANDLLRAKREASVAILEKPEYDLVLGIRVIREGGFHGLWELYDLTSGTSMAVGSATSKLSVINMARHRIIKVM